MILVDVVRVPPLHCIRLGIHTVSSSYAVPKTFVVPGFSSYNSIVQYIIFNADDLVNFRRKIETYIKSLLFSDFEEFEAQRTGHDAHFCFAESSVLTTS